MPLIPTSLPESLVNMYYMNDLLSVMLLAAVGLLALSLDIVRKLTKELPNGRIRTNWYLLGVMILLFFFGYLGFFAIKYGKFYTPSEMLVSVIFFFGGVFVLLVCLLAFRTTQELKRIFVLEQENITDPMLGIFNRRCLDRRIQEEVHRAQRYGLQLTMLMVDIDNFKRVNDTWGHQVGDHVLKHLAQLMSDSMRQTDVLARFGGEEFVILLPHTAEVEACKLAEKLRSIVELTPLHLIPELSVTISIGCASLLPSGDNAYALLGRADTAMYLAKRAGRNQTVAYPGNGGDGNRVTYP